jgi:hypothetical protein
VIEMRNSKENLGLWRPLKLLCVSCGLFFLGGWALGSGHLPVGLTLIAASTACAIWAFTAGVRLGRRLRGWRAGVAYAQACLATPMMLVVGIIMVFGSNIRQLFSASTSALGRQFHKNGQPQLPPLGTRPGWVTCTLPICAGSGEAAEVAALWRENGRNEHASIAAFARLSLDLLGLGAPARLLAQAQADGQDEIRHAEHCFSLAAALDGRELGPQAFTAYAQAAPRSRFRTLALAQIAIDSLVGGALYEGLSAAVASKVAKVCDDAIRPMLVGIAEDEGRHAAHAWDVIAWCVEEGGPPIRSALIHAVAALPATLTSNRPAAARSGAWVRYGTHSDAMQAEGYIKLRTSVVRRMQALQEDDALDEGRTRIVLTNRGTHGTTALYSEPPAC